MGIKCSTQRPKHSKSMSNQINIATEKKEVTMTSENNQNVDGVQDVKIDNTSDHKDHLYVIQNCRECKKKKNGKALVKML